MIDDWEYSLGSEYTNDENIVYLHYYKGTDTTVRVPAAMTVPGEAFPYRQTVIERLTEKNSIFPDTVESVSFENGVQTKAGGDISNMFANCKNLKSVDLTGFNTGGAANVSGMFSGCESLEYIDVSPMDVSGAANVAHRKRNTFTEHIFSGCSSLRSIDLSSWTINAYGNLKGMFSGCTSLETVKFCNIFDTSSSGGGEYGTEYGYAESVL